MAKESQKGETNMTLIERKQLIEKITGCKSLRITTINLEDTSIHEEWVLIDRLTDTLTAAFALALDGNVIYKIYYIEPHMLKRIEKLKEDLKNEA